MMEYLVREHGLDVNSDDEGKGAHRLGAPLHYAVRAGGIEKVKWLLHKGADPEMRNPVSGFQNICCCLNLSHCGFSNS